MTALHGLFFTSRASNAGLPGLKGFWGWAQYKTPEVSSRCGNLIRVNIYKDKIKNAGNLPPLPNATALTAALAPSYWTLNCVGRDKACGRPTSSITEQQQQAAEQFLKVS
jgi:hypothetical protein